MCHSRGFTLLELLVVMVMMGLMTAAAISTINYVFTDDTAEKHSERLAALVELAAEEALLTGRELGMRIDDDGYAFYQFDERAQAWSAINQQKVFRNRAFPEHIEISLRLEGQAVVLAQEDDQEDQEGEETQPDEENSEDNDFAEEPPQLMFFSSGQTTPFTLEVLDTRDGKRWQLEIDLLGRVEREQLE